MAEFKLASLFVTVEAQTAKYAQQMRDAKSMATDAGRSIGDTDIGSVGDRLEAVFRSLGPKIAAAFAPVAAQVEGSLGRATAPIDRIQASLTKVGAAMAGAFRFDLVHQGLKVADAAIGMLFAKATGGAAALGASLRGALGFANLINGAQRLRHQIASLLSPSKNLARLILAGAGVGMGLSQKALGLLFSRATGWAGRLGASLQKALSLGIAASKSKIVVNYLASMISRAVNLRGIVHGVGSALSRAAKFAFRTVTGLDAAKSSASGLRGILGEIAIAAGFAAVGFKVVEFFKGAIHGASDFRETMDKVNTVLGDAAPAVIAFADDLAARFGLVRTVTLDAASGFAGMAKALGKLKGRDLSDFANKFTKLSADFSSMANIDFGEAQKAIKIGLTGEPSDVLKQFGVIVNEATTRQMALNMGLKLTNGKLTEQQKLLARGALITKQLADADNNLEDTQDSTANRIRKASGQWENLATTIGTALLPVVNKALAMFGELTRFLASQFEKSKGSIQAFVDKVVIGMEVTAAAIRNWRTTLALAGLVAAEVVRAVREDFAILQQNLGIILPWIGKAFAAVFRGAEQVARSFFDNAATNIKVFVGTLARAMVDPFADVKFNWAPMLDSFQVTLEKLPDLVKMKMPGITKAMMDQWKGISDDVSWKAKVELGNKRMQPVDTPDAEAEKDDKGKVADIASFARSLQEAVGGKNRAAEETAKATKTTVQELRKLNGAMEVGGFGKGGEVAGPNWQMAGMA